MAAHTELVLLGAAATPQEHRTGAVLQRKPQYASPHHCRLQSGGSQPAGPKPGSRGARADTDFRTNHVALSGGQQPLQWLLGPLGAPFLERLVRPELVHLGERHGRFRAGAEDLAGYYQANPQNIRNLAAEKGPSSFDVKLNNVTTVVYQLPFGKGRKFGANMNPVVDAFVGGWEINSINTAHTGFPLDATYSASGANIVSS